MYIKNGDEDKEWLEKEISNSIGAFSPEITFSVNWNADRTRYEVIVSYYRELENKRIPSGFYIEPILVTDKEALKILINKNIHCIKNHAKFKEL